MVGRLRKSVRETFDGYAVVISATGRIETTARNGVDE